jgi:ribonuclease P protein component
VKRIYSLKGRNLIREVYQKGRKLQDSGLRMFFLKCRCDDRARPGSRKLKAIDMPNVKIAVIPAKTFGKAHARNKMKRMIRAICSELIIDLKNGFCIIIKADAGSRNLRFEEVRKIVRALFMKAGLTTREADTSIL